MPPYNILYNILQYFNMTIQYIAIIQNNNTIYCNTSKQQYNILQYFKTTIQYIAILLNDNTIYCNTFTTTIYCIGNNILQYIVIQYIVAQPCSKVPGTRYCNSRQTYAYSSTALLEYSLYWRTGVLLVHYKCSEYIQYQVLYSHPLRTSTP
jgi:hypothetical protein